MGCRKGFKQAGFTGYLGSNKRSAMPFEYCVNMKRAPGVGKFFKLGLNLEGVLHVLPDQAEFFFKF